MNTDPNGYYALGQRQRIEALRERVTVLERAIGNVLERPIPDGNASCATEIGRIRFYLQAALDG